MSKVFRKIVAWFLALHKKKTAIFNNCSFIAIIKIGKD